MKKIIIIISIILMIKMASAVVLEQETHYKPSESNVTYIINTTQYNVNILQVNQTCVTINTTSYCNQSNVSLDINLFVSNVTAPPAVPPVTGGGGGGGSSTIPIQNITTKGIEISVKTNKKAYNPGNYLISNISLLNKNSYPENNISITYFLLGPDEKIYLKAEETFAEILPSCINSQYSDGMCVNSSDEFNPTVYYIQKRMLLPYNVVNGTWKFYASYESLESSIQSNFAEFKINKLNWFIIILPIAIVVVLGVIMFSRSESFKAYKKKKKVKKEEKKKGKNKILREKLIENEEKKTSA